MKKIIFIALMLSSTATYANWFQDILDLMAQQAGITVGIMNEQVSVERDILSSQKDIEKLMREVNGDMTSHSGLGDYRFHDYQTYGNSARDWNSILSMAAHGQGNGELGDVMGKISHDFPAERDTYNKGISNRQSQHYYAVKTQTTLAANAASQLDLNRIEDQLAYQQMLRQQIERTKDLKAAMDLSNRIQVEGNLIALQLLRQSTLINQQQAVKEQASIVSALSNAKFLIKDKQTSLRGYEVFSRSKP